jgi:hypothetical protein
MLRIQRRRHCSSALDPALSACAPPAWALAKQFLNRLLPFIAFDKSNKSLA